MCIIMYYNITSIIYCLIINVIFQDTTNYLQALWMCVVITYYYLKLAFSDNYSNVSDQKNIFPLLCAITETRGFPCDENKICTQGC